ncbi:Menaquinol oxidase (H(+)-transporting) [Lentibacillus sp. JNUCC-1]|uniref:cytochrome c oxidase subunit I n=1 Tax=Lentibacillus sp. JNUCC-1 TaxID=2654513 RepID=UPI0012E880BA|nr:cbb3-type cytochrome c oxidase subunit I [Lentibacillus sp. JNUCC-1]MUV36343.1 Menaquinol oxidase (H(+)-transporting) [Lentibacillus sp. JNUCC-1]
MYIPFFEKHVPSDVIAAWVSVIIIGIVLATYVIKQNKWSVIWEYMRTTHHRKVGTLYMIFGFLFFLRAGVDALLIRSQLALPQNEFWLFQFQKYNEVFTTHGTMMIFFAATPMLLGLMNVAVPLQIGARDLAFPFLNAVGFWLFFAGGMLFNLAFFFDSAPAIGWTGYAPLSTSLFTPDVNSDYYVFGVQISGLGTIFTALNIIVTIFRHRAPGMKLMRMPLFTWASLITSFLILVAFTVLAIGLYLLMFDRMFDTKFFNGPDGDPIFWQHLFWIFGHPEVYILALPAFGLFSDIITTFSKKRIFGYPAMVISIGTIAFLAFTVWVHHMFTVGLGPLVNTVFALTTMAIAVPTGVKVFNWLFTMRGGVLRMTTPMLFSLGFIPSFVMGGVTGVMLSVSAADFQFHDSHFVVAHFHYVILASTILGIFAGIYYYFPKITGYQLNEKLGKWHFWLFLIGYHLTFFPMHITGMNGMPRRTFTYDVGEGLTATNFISTIGAFLMGIGVAVMFYNLFITIRKKERVGSDPWDGRTLEWTVASPAPEDSFQPMPIVKEMDPYWYAKQRGEDLETTDEKLASPISRDSIIPFIMANLLAVLSFGLMYGWIWLAVLAGAGVFMCFIIRAFRDEREQYYGKGEDGHESV